MSDKTNANEILLTNKQAAELLGYSPETLKGSRNKGVLAGVKAPKYVTQGNRSIKYRQSDLEAWIAENVG